MQNHVIPQLWEFSIEDTVKTVCPGKLKRQIYSMTSTYLDKLFLQYVGHRKKS